MANWVDFKTVRAALDFRAILAHYDIEEHGSGDQFKIICPFHNDHKPSCGINLKKQVYHCFACGAGGNALDFVAHMEGYDPEVPRELRKAALAAAEIFGIEDALSRPSKGQGKAKAKPKAKASPKPKAKQAKAKAEPKRAKPKQMAKVANDNIAGEQGEVEQAKAEKGREAANAPLTFKLDLNPSHEFIAERGFAPMLIEAFGIGFQDKGMMANRICFPIHNAEGELVAYSGRWASGDLPDDVPRYLLPPKFKKNLELFNLHRVLAERGEGCDTVVVVEGFWSVLRLHDAGVPCVSTFGDSVSKAQADLLVQHGITKAILIFDGDEGGRMGTKTSLPILAERLFVKSLALEDGIKPDTMSEEVVASLPRF